MSKDENKPSQEDKDPKDQEKKSSVRVSQRLQDFDIFINSFGEIISNYDVDKINNFLNKNVEDKKLKNRKDNPFDQQKSETDSDDSDSKE